ncbi:MAG: class I SAM-dependent methyltransferase [Myxococcota bacterium]
MTIHRTAERGFSLGAGAYERSRPDYPPRAVTFLAQVLELSAGHTVVDLAAGTGKWTEQLAPLGAKLIAVEPLSAMRAHLATTVPSAQVLGGTAEALPLAHGSVDAVLVAQAFHWFDAEKAAREIHRVLRPGGGLGLVWNVRDEAVPWVATLNELLSPYQEGTPHFGTGAWRAPFERGELFEPLQSRQFAHEQTLDADALCTRLASISFIAVLPEAKRTAVLDKARALVADMPRSFTLPYVTEVRWTRRR